MNQGFTRGRIRWFPVLLALLALVVAACSTGSNTAAKKPASSTAMPNPDGPTSGAVAVAAARVRVAPWLRGTYQTPPKTGPKAAAGAKIYVVSCGQFLESCSTLVAGVLDGAKAIGWETTLVDTKLDFASAGDAIRQAMAAKARGAIVVGVDCQYFAGALDDAKAAKFPVVVLNAFDCDTTSGGKEPARFAAQVDFTPGNENPVDNAKRFAAAKADWAIVKTNAKLKVINLEQQDLLSTKLLGKGFADGVARCASCSVVDTIQFATSDLLDGTFSQKISQSIVQHPEADAINFPFAATVSLGLSGLKDSGRSDLIVIGAEGAPSQYQLLNNGTIAMVMAFPAGWTGWAAVDSLNREFAKAPQVYEGVGYKLVTAKEMNGAPTFTVPVDYEAAYRKL
ncbi:MAG: hypothetical protein JWL83_1787 [Actinomycetia bacterium]|nr:hypothetical protein [Actinomycetes bacterium]